MIDDRTTKEEFLESRVFLELTQEQKTQLEEMRPWLEGRKEAGRRIDPNSVDVEFTFFWAELDDPYGVLDLPPWCSCVGRRYFVRSPDSDGWVDFSDLPEGTVHQLEKRIRAGELVDSFENDFSTGCDGAVACPRWHAPR